MSGLFGHFNRCRSNTWLSFVFHMWQTISHLPVFIYSKQSTYYPTENWAEVGRQKGSFHHQLILIFTQFLMKLNITETWKPNVFRSQSKHISCWFKSFLLDFKEVWWVICSDLMNSILFLCSGVTCKRS